MFPTLALVAALSLAPAQNGTLSFSNDRLTFGGVLGSARPNNRFLPGDLLQLVFDIEGLKMNNKGLVQYSISMDVTNAAGKSIYTTTPQLQGAYLALGGNKLPANAWTFLGTDTPAGTYSCKILIVDQESKAKKELVKAFEVLPPAFGVVGVRASIDEAGDLHCPLGGMVGQPLWLRFNVVQFGRDAQTKQPNVTCDINVLEHGKPTNPIPFPTVPVTSLANGVMEIGYQILVPLNRAGDFTIQIKTDCKVTGKTTTLNIPITVAPAPK